MDCDQMETFKIAENRELKYNSTLEVADTNLFHFINKFSLQ